MHFVYVVLSLEEYDYSFNKNDDDEEDDDDNEESYNKRDEWLVL